MPVFRRYRSRTTYNNTVVNVSSVPISLWDGIVVRAQTSQLAAARMQEPRACP